MANPWWVSLVGVIVGAILGFGASEYREWKERRRKRYGNFEALGVEIQLCAEIAAGYLSGNVMAPAYRMPTVAYQKAFPEILVDGVLAVNQTSALVRFYVNVVAFNFCVDQAQQVLMKKPEERPDQRLEREVRRAKLKASKLVKGGSQYELALAVIKAHLPAESRARLAIPEGELVEEDAD